MILPDINSVLHAYFWPLLRIGAAVAVVPIFGAGSVPVRVRLGLALILTVVIAPLTLVPPGIEILSPSAVVIAGTQVLIGLAIGFALLLVFAAFVVGGQVIAMQMGLGFAALIDPQNGIQTPVISQFYVLLATLIFLTLDGHLIAVQVLADSFQQMPVGQSLSSVSLWGLVSMGTFVFEGAVSIALPGILTLLITNMTLGIITRASPQLNIFAVGFPLMIVLGFVVIYATLDVSASHLSTLVAGILRVLSNIGITG